MTITVEDHATPGLRAMMARLRDRTALHAEMGMAVERQVARHMRDTKVPQGNRLGGTSTGFWMKAIASIKGTSDRNAARVWIPARGVALQYYGGTVRAKNKPYLTIPISPLSHGKSVKEMGGHLYRFLSKKGNLILATDPNPSRGGSSKSRKPRSGPPRYRGGTPLYVLLKSVHINAHPDVLPQEAAIGAEAAKAATKYIARIFTKP